MSTLSSFQWPKFSPECWISGLSISSVGPIWPSQMPDSDIFPVYYFWGLSFFLFLAVPPTACGILVPQPGIEPKPLAVEARSLNHWTTRREVSLSLFFFLYSFLAQVITDLCHNQPQEFASCSNGRLSPWALPLEINIPGNPDPRLPSKKLCKGILFECWLSMRLKIR